MPKENCKTVESSFGQRKVCEFDRNQLQRNVSNDALQHSPYPTPASGGPSVLARSKRTQQQEPEGSPYIVPPTSTENEGPCLKHLCTMRQPDPESATAVELTIGSGEVVGGGHGITIHEVRAHIISIHHRGHGFVQVPGDVHDAGVNFFCRTTKCHQSCKPCQD